MADWIRDFIADGGYLAIGALMLLETVFPPVPSEIIMSLAGLEAAEGSITLWGAILAGTTGAMIGNYMWFALAAHFGVDRLRPFVERWGRFLTIRWREVRRADDLFDRHGHWFVLFGRMMPTIRSLVSVPAGLFGMPLRTFLVFSTIGTAGWTSALALAGYGIGVSVKDVDRYLDAGSTIIIGALVAWYLYRVVTWKPDR